MNTIVLSYSYTGNNRLLAAGVAQQLGARHIQIVEDRTRSELTIMLDMMFNRTPAVQPSPDILDGYDRVVFVAPVWMGKIASPIRPYLRRLKQYPAGYAFLSISGGADGPNPKLESELISRTGTKPEILRNLHIADLLPADPKPTRTITSAYRLNDREVAALTDKMMMTLKGV